MVLELIIGLGITAIVLVYLMMQLDEAHIMLKIIILLFLPLVLLLIPSALISERQICEIVISNQTVIGNMTTNQYTNYCVSPSGSTDKSFLKFSMWYLTITYVYVLVYLIYHVFLRKKLLDMGILKSKGKDIKNGRRN